MTSHFATRPRNSWPTSGFCRRGRERNCRPRASREGRARRHHSLRSVHAGMDGILLIRAAQDRRPYLPAILLTGYAGEFAALATGLRIRGSLSTCSASQLMERSWRKRSRRCWRKTGIRERDEIRDVSAFSGSSAPIAPERSLESELAKTLSFRNKDKVTDARA